jgi:hypothetical protein
MKSNTLFGVALCLMMLATVGRGADNPKAVQGLSQAGHSSIYFYDVAASQTHGKGKLQINVDKRTFEFNGQGFEPSTQIALRARTAASSELVVFALAKTTESGNLHMSGTWQAGAAAAEVVADEYYPPIYAFRLENFGWFVVQVACYYSTDEGVTWQESNHSDGIAINNYAYVYLNDFGIAGEQYLNVPLGALVKIHAIVIGGKDRTGSEIYRFTEYGDGGACYEIWGTTTNPTLAIEY